MNNKFSVTNDYVIVYLNSNAHGDFQMFMDFDDFEKLKHHKFRVRRCRDKFYSYVIINKKHILLHRLILDCPENLFVDHIGGHGTELDNRRSNLRICTIHENNMNHGLSKLNKSGVTGVIWNNHIPTPKWMAYIKVNYKFINLGYFDDMEDAINARKNAEVEYFGEFARNSQS